MFSTRVQDRVPTARSVGSGYIRGHRLIFHKLSDDGSAKCDAEVSANADDRVYGVLLELSRVEKPKLDDAEGLHHGYEEKHVDVVTRSGSRSAIMYYATSKNPSLKPYHWYKAFIVAGAVEHKLPSAYIEWLRTTESVQDADLERRLKNERLLSVQQQRSIRSARSRRV